MGLRCEIIVGIVGTILWGGGLSVAYGSTEVVDGAPAQKIIRQDNRTLINMADFYAQNPGAPLIGSLRIELQNEPDEYCTFTRLSPTRGLTAAHCFFSSAGQPRAVRQLHVQVLGTDLPLRLLLGASGLWARSADLSILEPLRPYLATQAHQSDHAVFDLSQIQVALESIAAGVGYGCSDSEGVIGERGDNVGLIRIISGDVLDQRVRQGNGAWMYLSERCESYGWDQFNTLQHACDTQPGASGAAIFPADSWRIIGTHIGGNLDPRVETNRWVLF